MLIPFEVVRHICGYITPKEMRECLLVCKSWYRPMFESLYSSVILRKSRSFRAFLYIIAHHELMPGKFVKEIELYIEDFDERPVTFTEFELLSRYCVNLNVLLFSHNRYWRCLNDLDLSNVWPHLRKVPISRNRLSFDVCTELKDRLVEVAFFAQDDSILTFMASPCPRLLKIDIASRHILLTLSTLRQLHHCAPFLREACLISCMENTSDGSYNVPLIENKQNHIENLTCLIHHPDSAWFPMIKSTYHSIDKLSLIISNIPPHHTGYTYRPYTKFEIVRAIIDLIKNTAIRELEMDFKFVEDVSFMQAATATLLYDHCNDPNNPMPVSVKAYFVVPGEFDYHNRFKSKLTTTQVQGQNLVHHDLEYRFLREIDDNDDSNVSELDLLEYTLISPINKLVKELSLDIGIGDEFFWSNVITRKRCINFDQILNYYSNLESLVISSNLYDFCGNSLQSDVRFTFSSTSKSHKNNNLKFLTVQNVTIDKHIYKFLFKYCMGLLQLTLINCQIDEVTTLALECLCLESDISLQINQDRLKNTII